MSCVLCMILALLGSACARVNSAKSVQSAKSAGGNSVEVQQKGSFNRTVAAKPTPSPRPKPELCAQHVDLTFEQLSDFISDNQKRRNGDCMVVTDVPRFVQTNTMEDEYGNHKGLYYLKSEVETDVSNGFMCSPDLAKAIGPHLNEATPLLRVTAVRVQFSDEIEIFWSPYAIKVEGLDNEGNVLWTVNGKPPAKLKFPV